MVMELIHGETLARLRVKGSLTQALALDFTGQVLRALVYAHRLGVVHRDIKPSNIMITENGVVKLLDFGIALTAHAGELTRTGYLLGSLNYMSPEQASGTKASSRSDLYSVGVTLYELLTGVLPITGQNNYEIMLAHMQRVPVPPHVVAPQVPLALSDAVMRALEKDPAHRFHTAEEFLHALELLPAGPEQATALTQPLPQHRTASGVPRPTTDSQPRTPSGSGVQSLPLEEITRKLAVYIGPVAKFVVKKLAAQFDDMDAIYREAAKQIGSDADRAAFLRSRRQ
jgi:serine/threonine-protein kinase